MAPLRVGGNTISDAVIEQEFDVEDLLRTTPEGEGIVSEFEGLDEILAATDAELEAIEGVGDMRAKDIREGLRRLQEINLVDRYLQT